MWRVGSLSLYPLNRVFHRPDILNFDEIQLVKLLFYEPYLFYFVCLFFAFFLVVSKNFCLLDPSNFLCSPTTVFLYFHISHLSHYLFSSKLHIDMRLRLKFAFFACGCPMVQHHLSKRQSCFHWIIFACLLKISRAYSCKSILVFSVLFHWSIFLLFHVILISIGK